VASADRESTLEDVVRGWLDHPQLDALARRVLFSAGEEAARSALAEAAVADHLLQRGCSIRVEIPTPRGRSCDFEVTHEDVRVYVHVKRLRGVGTVHLAAPAALRRLERIERPFVVLVRWIAQPSGRLSSSTLREAERFLRGAQLGDEAILHDTSGGELARMRLIARAAQPHIMIALALADAPDDRRQRILRLLRRAHEQFMPGGENVILLCADAASEHELETALSGTHIERWDRLPPRGERVAHGHSDDGFWSGRRHERSRLVGRFELGEDGRYTAPVLHRRPSPAGGPSSVARGSERAGGEGEERGGEAPGAAGASGAAGSSGVVKRIAALLE
jgi:Holliday junction resolvase-like predicted endonuclease